MLPRLYNLLFPVVFLLLLPGYLGRMVRRGDYRWNFWQRLGFFSPEVTRRLRASRGAIWLQAVSVGEMMVALKLAATLRERQPDLPLVISTTTTTGYALAVRRVPGDVTVIYSPVDFGPAVRRTFGHVLPAQVVIVDGGLWPNQLWEARRRKIPTALVNARLSPRSERRFRQYAKVARGLFGVLDLVGVPYPEDVERWTQLGIPANQIEHTGSIKFDDEPASSDRPGPDFQPPGFAHSPREFLRASGIAADAPILLAASTHAGEERMITEVFMRLRMRFPTLFLIIVPRHVERTPEVQSALARFRCRVALRTVLPSVDLPPDILLVNVTGELPQWYETATLAFIGKSLNAVGGQNPGEAVLADVPVVFGPHMENFQELSSRLLDAGGAVQVKDLSALEQRVGELLTDRPRCEGMARTARQVIAVHRGASGRTVDLLLALRRKTTCENRSAF